MKESVVTMDGELMLQLALLAVGIVLWYFWLRSMVSKKK